MQSKPFGDGISWENHVDEIFEKHPIDQIYYKHNESNTIMRMIRDNTPNYWDTNEALNVASQGWCPSLLDCGCHIGRWGNFFIDAGFRYTGIDQSPYALEKAREFVSRGVFVESFLWDFDLDNKQHDIAVCVAVLQHNRSHERSKIVPNIRRHLKDGALFFFTESTRDERGHGTETQGYWIALGERSGFKLLDIQQRDHYIFKAV